jgi:hypothetical protein
MYLIFDLTFLILPFQALERICDEAADAIQGELGKKGVQGVILSDTMAGSDRMALPSLIAVGAVHQHLLKTKQRPKVRTYDDHNIYLLYLSYFCTLSTYLNNPFF